MVWAPLPIAKGNLPERTGKFIDIEVVGLYATRGNIGDLDITNTLTLKTGGIIRTASSGQRVEITEADKDSVRLFTGDSFEGTFPGHLRGLVSGSGDTRVLQITIRSPASTTGTDGGTFIIVRTESADDSSTPPGIILGSDSGSTQTGVVGIQNNLDLQLASGSYIHVGGLGAADDLVLGIGSNNDDGLFSPFDTGLSVVLGGNEVTRYEATRVDFDIGALSFITLPVKTTTGDPSSPKSGDTYTNEFDNKIRTYADGAWRDLATW